MIWLGLLGIPVTIAIAVVTGEPAWLISTAFAVVGTWQELADRSSA